MHNGFVQIDGEKMSKSLGNSFFLKDALKLYDGEVLRYYLNSVHYRNDFNFSEEELQTSKKRLDKLYRLKKNSKDKRSYANLNNKYKNSLLSSLKDDLNISKALSYIEQEIQSFNSILEKVKNKKISNIFIYQKTLERLLKKDRKNTNEEQPYKNSINKYIKKYCNQLNIPPENNNEFIKYMKQNSSIKIENYRSKLSSKHFFKEYKNNLLYEIQTFIQVLNNILGIGGKEPFSYFQIGVDEALKTQIETLVAERIEAKKAKDFARSDAIRDELIALGISIMDTADGTLWEKA
jgi:cysteinyl-tRNA synthetase